MSFVFNQAGSDYQDERVIEDRYQRLNGIKVYRRTYYPQAKALVTQMHQSCVQKLFNYAVKTWLVAENLNELHLAKINTENVEGDGYVFNGGRFVFALKERTIKEMPFKDRIEEHVWSYINNTDLKQRCNNVTISWKLFISMSIQDQEVHKDWDDDKVPCFLTTFVPLTPEEVSTVFYDEEGRKVIPPVLKSSDIVSFPGDIFHKGQRNNGKVRLVLIVHAQDEKAIEEYAKHTVTVFEKDEDKKLNLSQIYTKVRNSIGISIDKDEKLDLMCYNCRQYESKEGNDMLICDGKNCDAACHLQCCTPPLRKVPSGNWYCRHCDGTDEDETDEDETEMRRSRRVFIDYSTDEETEAEETVQETNDLFKYVDHHLSLNSRSSNVDHSEPPEYSTINKFQNRKIEKNIREYVIREILDDDNSCDCANKKINLSLSIICKDPPDDCMTSFLNEKKTQVFSINDKQKGLRAVELIERGEFIIEYVGEIIDENTWKERTSKIKNNELYNGMSYFVSLITLKGDKYFIDAGNIKKANNARYANSSCEPNAELQTWADAVTGLLRVGLFALKDIPKDEEIKWLYGKEFFSGDKPCECGSAKCLSLSK